MNQKRNFVNRSGVLVSQKRVFLWASTRLWLTRTPLWITKPASGSEEPVACSCEPEATDEVIANAVVWHPSAVHLDDGGHQREERRAHVDDALIHDQHVDRLHEKIPVLKSTVAKDISNKYPSCWYRCYYYYYYYRPTTTTNTRRRQSHQTPLFWNGFSAITSLLFVVGRKE